MGAILDACAFLLSEYLQVYKAVRVLSFRYEGSEGCFLNVEQNLCYKRAYIFLRSLHLTIARYMDTRRHG